MVFKPCSLKMPQGPKKGEIKQVEAAASDSLTPLQEARFCSARTELL